MRNCNLPFESLGHFLHEQREAIICSLYREVGNKYIYIYIYIYENVAFSCLFDACPAYMFDSLPLRIVVPIHFILLIFCIFPDSLWFYHILLYVHKFF